MDPRVGWEYSSAVVMDQLWGNENHFHVFCLMCRSMKQIICLEPQRKQLVQKVDKTTNHFRNIMHKAIYISFRVSRNYMKASVS